MLCTGSNNACWRRGRPEGLRYRSHQDLAVSEGQPQLAKIRVGKMREHPQVDVVGGEGIGILLKTKRSQPRMNVVGHWLPVAFSFSFLYLRCGQAAATVENAGATLRFIRNRLLRRVIYAGPQSHYSMSCWR